MGNATAGRSRDAVALVLIGALPDPSGPSSCATTSTGGDAAGTYTSTTALTLSPVTNVRAADAGIFSVADSLGLPSVIIITDGSEVSVTPLSDTRSGSNRGTSISAVTSPVVPVRVARPATRTW